MAFNKEGTQQLPEEVITILQRLTSKLEYERQQAEMQSKYASNVENGAYQDGVVQGITFALTTLMGEAERMRTETKK